MKIVEIVYRCNGSGTPRSGRVPRTRKRHAIASTKAAARWPRWAPRAGGADCDGLALPPADAAAFAEFADAVVRSARIAAFFGRDADD